MMDMRNVPLSVFLAKQEILRDIERGELPASVRSFSELHEYVDANYYGGAFESMEAFGIDDAAGDDAFCRYWNRVHDELDLWLRRGRRG